MVPYNNVMITLKFNDTTMFWQKYPKALNDIMKEIIGEIKNVSAVAQAIASALAPLGLYSVQVLGNETGHGLEIVVESVEQKVQKVKKAVI